MGCTLDGLDRKILLHLNDQLGIGQPQAIPHGGSEHFRISLASDLHLAPPFGAAGALAPGLPRSFPITLPWNP